MNRSSFHSHGFKWLYPVSKDTIFMQSTTRVNNVYTTINQINYIIFKGLKAWNKQPKRTGTNYETRSKYIVS